MASFFRKRIASKVISMLQKRDGIQVPTTVNLLSTKIKINRNKSPEPELVLFWSTIERMCNHTNTVSLKELVKLLRNQGLPTSEGFIDIKLAESPSSLIFTVDKHIFSKIVLMDICTNQNNLAKGSCLFEDIQKKNIVVQSSSPAIGEYYNMTHFRIAIHNQFITNINRFVGHNVINVTHVYDWGIEAAIFLTGYKQFICDTTLKDSCSHLFEIMKASLQQYKNDLKFKDKADQNFNNIENGDLKLIAEWDNLKDICTNYFNSIYKKIGINFDEKYFDSSSYKRLKEILDELIEKNISEIDECINLDDWNSSSTDINNIDAILFHLSRYLNVAIEIENKHKFDLLYYVASSSQKDFLSKLFSVMKKFNFPWIDNIHQIDLKSISAFEFKRKKNLLLEDILGKVKDGMITKLQQNLQMEINESLEEMAEQLSISSLIIHDMKHRRCVDYNFNIKDILSFQRDTGASFQLCYAGLKGMQDDSEYEFKNDIDTSALLEPHAHYLIQHLARFDEMVHKSYCLLEPYIIIQYLTSLWYFTDQATNILKLDIKESKLRVIKARLLLLSATLKILGNGLNILGIKPLEKVYVHNN